MDRPNVHEPVWDRELAEPPFRQRVARVGRAAGARDLGASVYELDPGGVVSPYHLHHAQEELLVVLEGTPEVRTPDGVAQLRAGDVVAFPTGPQGAHQVRNPGPGPARVLLVSTVRYPEVGEYPDTGAALVFTAPGHGFGVRDGERREVWPMVVEDLERHG